MHATSVGSKNPALCLFLFSDTPEATGQTSQFLLFKVLSSCFLSPNPPSAAQSLQNWAGNQIFQTARVEEFCCVMPLDRAFMVNLQKSLTFSAVLILNNIFSLSTAVFNCCSQNRTTQILTEPKEWLLFLFLPQHLCHKMSLNWSKSIFRDAKMSWVKNTFCLLLSFEGLDQTDSIPCEKKNFAMNTHVPDRSLFPQRTSFTSEHSFSSSCCLTISCIYLIFALSLHLSAEVLSTEPTKEEWHYLTFESFTK